MSWWRYLASTKIEKERFFKRKDKKRHDVYVAADICYGEVVDDSLILLRERLQHHRLDLWGVLPCDGGGEERVEWEEGEERGD